MSTADELGEIHRKISPDIEGRLDQFRRLWNRGGERDMVAELVFCLLTPQSKAKVCWAAVEKLMENGVLEGGKLTAIERELLGVRFKRKKALYVFEVLKKFRKMGVRMLVKEFENAGTAREWLVQNVKGAGYKEASHFLRNVGFTDELAILDRHVLKNLKALGVVEKIPNSLTRKKYLEIENRMKKLSEKIKIPMGHLDLVLWYKETGEVFK